MLLLRVVHAWPLMSCDALAELTKNPVEGFSAGLVDDDDIYKWEIMIMGPPDTL